MMVNERGFIPIVGLGYLISAFIILFALLLMWLFAKSLLVSTILLLVAGAFIWFGLNEKKNDSTKKFLLIGGLIMIVIALPIGIIQPFSIVGEEINASYYEGSHSPPTYVAFTDFERSFLSNQTATIYMINNGILIAGLSGKSLSLDGSGKEYSRIGSLTSSFGAYSNFFNFKYAIYVDNELVKRDIGNISVQHFNPFSVGLSNSSFVYSHKSYFINPFDGSSTYGDEPRPDFFIKTNSQKTYSKVSTEINFSNLDLVGGKHNVKVYAYPTRFEGILNVESSMTKKTPEQIFQLALGDKYDPVYLNQITNVTIPYYYYTHSATAIAWDFSNNSIIQDDLHSLVFDGTIFVEAPECADNSNFVTKMFTVSAGDVVSLNPQLGEIGIEDTAIFCHTLPVLKQVGGVIFEQDFEPYDSLQRGEKVTIPAGQNWILFYKDIPSSSSYLFCADNEGIYNSVTNRCEIFPAIEYTCVSGVFDPIKKTCVTQAVVAPICSEGVYNTQTQRCEYTPPTSILCPQGNYDEVIQKCLVVPEIYASCISGTTFDAVTGYCVFTPSLVNVCSKGTYDAELNQCVYIASIQNVCVIGTFDVSLNKCVYNPPVTNVCVTGTYDAVLNKCVYVAEISNICTQGTYDSISQKCVYNPPVARVCNIGTYNPVSFKCEYNPPIFSICLQGIYNPVNSLCEYNPPSSAICSNGVFNPSTSLCEYNPENTPVCLTGAFNNVTQSCEVTPNTVNVCSTGIFDSSLGVCVVEGVIETQCSVGVLEDGVCVVDAEVVDGFTSNLIIVFGVISVIVFILGVFLVFFSKKKKGR